MNKDEQNQLSISVPGEWAVKKLLGPALDEVGSDLQKLYSIGRDKILAVALRKSNVDDGKKANLRVTRDVFWNGSFTDEAICAEYFGGILAASRSEDGKDDSGVFYVDIIKSLSSGQLKMHYLIYRTLNKELAANEDKKSINPGQETELVREKLFIPIMGIIEQFNNEDLGSILHGLNSKGLIGDFQTENHKLEDDKTVPYLRVQPKTLGVQLFAIANNRFVDWRKFPMEDFGDFEGVILPTIYAPALDEMLKRAGLQKDETKST